MTGIVARAGGLMVLGVLAAALGCGQPASGGAEMVVAVDRGLAGIQESIFSKSCAYGSCHSGNLAAAHLDLAPGRACASLVGRSSCLFPSKMLVKAGDPAASFLVAKLTGEGTGTPPESPCVGSSNALMPFGAQPLSTAQIQAIRDWITDGADCNDGSGAPDGGAAADGGGAPDGSPPETTAPGAPVVAAVAPAQATVTAGTELILTVTLSAPAPDGGLTLSVTPEDFTVVASPREVFVDEGESRVTFRILGRRPGTVRVSAALAPEEDSSRAAMLAAPMAVEITVTGLYLAEIFAGSPGGRSDAQWVKLMNATTVPIDLGDYRLGAGVGAYGPVSASTVLSGILPPASCAVAGGPYAGPDNGAPDYAQQADFAPDLPDGPGGTSELAVYGLFDIAAPLDATAVPIDAVGVGQQNGAAVRGPGGDPLAPAAAAIPPGDSLSRSGPTTWTVGPPSPGACVPD